MVILDQFIDFTKHRINTFFEDFSGGNIQHQAMADPFNEDLRNKLISACKVNDIKHHTTGTMVTIEGPRFSTRAESHMFRVWGADVINMTTATEAALANEAAIPYAAIAMSTDYDCWKTDEDPVSMDDVFKVFKENASKITKILEYIIREWK
jgi:5'-methylthioadenosine phosphorylase